MIVLRFLVWLLVRSLLWLRYRVRLHGVEKVRSLDGPLLILPNHPAFIEPVLMVTMMSPLFRPRPLLYEENFKGLFYPVLPLLNAIPVPDLEQSSADARQRATEAIDAVKQALRQKQNVILWPSGRLQRAGLERLGAARTLSEVLADVPEAKILLVRSTGLWGSRTSWGFTGKSPPLVKRLLQGVGLILSNLIFFAPRRTVDVELEYMERSRLPGLDRAVLNPFLEQWYNQGDAPATPFFVPFHFLFGPRSYEFPALGAAEEIDLSGVPADTKKAVDEMLEAKLSRPLGEAERKPETTLEQLGLDSLDRMEVSLNIERRFHFSGDSNPVNVGQLYALAAGLAKREPPKPPPASWFTPVAEGGKLLEINGDTIPDAILSHALSHRKDVICADDLAGALTYEKFLVGALTMSRRFATMKGANVGVLLPSSVACDLVLTGLYLAGKLPVLLNWTTGPANLAHAAKVMGLKHVVTSKAFVDRLGVAVEGTSYVHLEEQRQSMGKWELFSTLMRVRFFPDSIRQGVPKVDPDSPAVVLFTSGSEKAPKAVPLSHRNLLSNQRGGIAVLKPRREDVILGFLPAFHSFGVSITGLFPLLTGLRVVRHPDPTDAAALARKIGSYKPTILVGTPTFVSYILKRAEPGELSSLRLVVVGAEKCPQDVFEGFAKVAPQAKVLEGYGITECSPVVSVNPPEDNRPGTVGKALPGVELRVSEFSMEGELHIGKALGVGEMGMLLVAGPSVFGGYLGQEASPFRELDGKRWYVTGDLVRLDADGFIHFSGRLKRFLKAGGEMISLPALEEPFVNRFPPTKDGPRVAVEGMELDGGGRRIVLFTTEEIALREANDVLVSEGFHGVMRLDEVRRVEKLPVLGTGKTDYKVLRAQLG